jgi:putative SOS response-associated peptidase YedK
MCGRYVLSLKPLEVRRQLEESHMPVDDAPKDDELRQSYNFAPGYHGLVYRADGPDYGNKSLDEKDKEQAEAGEGETVNPNPAPSAEEHVTKYKLQAMKWGLVPFWTKRNPDYGGIFKTINCRDDSLYEDRGMWTSMKKKKRCIVVAQGFYEWLKKNNGKEKIPHYTRRKDGQLMCFAGLWDCVKLEGSDEMLYTYTIITTDSNKQLSFLHDRMPVILENGSEAIRTWLDPNRTEWSKELQSLLKPYEGELECYPVSKDVGKVGNNSPSFVVPINSAENKNNIANFFGNQRKAAKGKEEAKAIGNAESDLKTKGFKVEHDINETRDTTDQLEGTEDNAPLPAAGAASSKGIKRERSEGIDEGDTADGTPPDKRRISAFPGPASQSPQKSPGKATKKMRSATSNRSAAKGSPNKAGDGSRKITSFFTK